MNEFIVFLKDIFMIKEAAPLSVGLSQFKSESIVEQPKKEKKADKKDCGNDRKYYRFYKDKGADGKSTRP